MGCQVSQRDSMKALKLFISILLTLAIGQSCSPERKSASYYQENKKEISELKNEYDALYRQQAFSAGFTDKTFKYYVMQIITDTLRAIYNSEKRKDELWQNVLRFHYDTVALKKMAAMMKKIKCLWVGKTDRYFGEKREVFTYISFQSADRAFRENKYYVLILPDRKVDYPEVQEQIKKGENCADRFACVFCYYEHGIGKVGARRQNDKVIAKDELRFAKRFIIDRKNYYGK